MASPFTPSRLRLSDAHIFLSLFNDILETQGKNGHFSLDSRSIFSRSGLAKPLKLSCFSLQKKMCASDRRKARVGGRCQSSPSTPILHRGGGARRAEVGEANRQPSLIKCTVTDIHRCPLMLRCEPRSILTRGHQPFEAREGAGTSG